jgi:hypothetical protein
MTFRGGRIFSRVDEAFALLPLRLFVFLSAGRSERRFLRDDDASERARASFDVPPEREPMTMVRARPRDADINAASTTYSFFRSLYIT